MPTAGASPILVPPLYQGVGAGAPVMEVKTASFGATAGVNVTLPAIGTGPFHFRVINGSDVDLTATAAVADTIITFNDLAADSVAFATSSEKIGGELEVLSDGTSLFVLARVASIYQTTTIVTA
jgi:hypothetical protein